MEAWTSMPRVERMIAGGRILYGTALLLTPDAVLGRLHAGRIDHRARLVVRVLGVRQLLEAMLVGPGASPRRIRVGVMVDAAHAASMVALARVDPPRRRLATASALVAGGFALTGLAEARRGSTSAEPAGRPSGG